jgi:hypothetical protein
LINALTLHNRLFTFVSGRWGERAEKSLTLYQYLKKRNILKVIDTYREEPPGMNDVEMWEFKDLLRPHMASNDDMWGAVGFGYYYPINAGSSYSERQNLIRSILEHDKDIFSFFNEGEREYDELQFRIRTALYWAFSNACNIPFQPDFVRIPIIYEHNARIRQSLRMFMAASIDKLVREELDNALSIAEVKTIPIPNLLLRFLNLYSKHDLDYSLDNLRNEFADQKQALTEWETRLKDSKSSYSECIKIIKEIYSSLESITPRDKGDIALSVGPAVLSDILSGSPGISTANTALSEGLDAVRRWSRSSHISYFTKGKKEAQSIRNEPELIEKVFGRSLSFRETEMFLSLANALDSLHVSPQKRN